MNIHFYSSDTKNGTKMGHILSSWNVLENVANLRMCIYCLNGTRTLCKYIKCICIVQSLSLFGLRLHWKNIEK